LAILAWIRLWRNDIKAKDSAIGPSWLGRAEVHMPEYSIPDPPKLVLGRSRGKGRQRFVVVTHLGANSLEYMGPIQVLEEANFFLERMGRSDLCYDVEVVSTQTGVVYETKGLKVVADTPYHRLRGNVDTLMFQAVAEDEGCLADERFLAWVRQMSKRVRRMTSICVGTFVLAEAGLLEGRRATTHWVACEDFRRRYPTVKLDPDPIYVKDGNIYTSAGSTSGLDLTLALVEEDFGKEFARRVAQGLVMFLRRPGNQAQFSVHLSTKFPDEQRIQEVQTYVAENSNADLSVEALARRIGMSLRNFSRVFAREVGMTPGRFVELSRLEKARQSLEQSELPISQVADQCGYGTSDGLRLAFERHVGVSPRAYRQRFA
jgi:transcriptional regulator GlxA family with amidase domain